MKTFNNVEEMKPYYNEKTNTYKFDDDVRFTFDLTISSNISAENINARDINARSIKARDIYSSDIKARDIKADDIIADDIIAYNIDARDISFYGLCCAYEEFICNSIAGRKEKSKYFCLDGEVIIKEKSNV